MEQAPIGVAALEQGPAADEPALSWLLAVSHTMPPDALGAVVAEAAQRLGVCDAEIYLADYAQVRLTPLRDEAAFIDVDGTLAGRSFQRAELLLSPGPRPRVWLPLLSGSERLGVLELMLNDESEGPPNSLAVRFATLVALLIQAHTQNADLVAKRRRAKPMRLSAEMQRVLLPPLTLLTPQVAIAGFLEPAYEVAGDVFDYAVNDSTLHLAVIDAMGHGRRATLLSALAIGSYRNQRRSGAALQETMVAMDAAVRQESGGEAFATALLGELDLRSGEVRLVSAGHPPPLLVREGQLMSGIELLPSVPLGLGTETIDVARVQLQPDDQLLLYSDGAVEARAEDGELFGEERLADHVVRQLASGASPPETMRRLASAIFRRPDYELRDDATLLFVQWHGPDATSSEAVFSE